MTEDPNSVAYWREYEDLVDEIEAEFGPAEIEQILRDKYWVPSVAELRRNISDQIMRLELQDFIREDNGPASEFHQAETHLADSREDAGPSSNLKEEIQMSQQVTSSPIRGAAALTAPSTPTPSASEAGFIGRLLDNWRRSGPLPVIAGVKPVPTDNRVTPNVAGDDAELLAKTSHVRGRKETLTALIARTGISPNQILTMTRDEISRFVEIAKQNALNEPARFAAMPLPKKIYADLESQ